MRKSIALDLFASSATVLPWARAQARYDAMVRKAGEPSKRLAVVLKCLLALLVSFCVAPKVFAQNPPIGGGGSGQGGIAP